MHHGGSVCWTTFTFENLDFPTHVRKLKKTYGLKQVPRAWYEWLSKFLIDSGFNMRKTDTTFFNKRKENDLPIIQRGTDESLCENFVTW